MVNLDIILKMAKALIYPVGISTAEQGYEWVKLKNVFSTLLEEYENRPYHNLFHILQGLKFYETRIKYNSDSISKEVIIAWLLHDVLMNERECANLAKVILSNADIDKHTVDIVTDLIYATGMYTDAKGLERYLSVHANKGWTSSSERTECFNWVALADLKVMWCNSITEYQHYARSVEQESIHRYHISLEAYIEKRINFLHTYIKQGFFPTLPDTNIKSIMIQYMEHEINELSDFIKQR